MNIIKKIALGAYYISTRQGNDGYAAYVTAKIGIGATILINFIIIGFFLMLLGFKFDLPPFKPLCIVVILITIILPIGKKDWYEETIRDTKIAHEAQGLFYKILFGPILLFIFTLFFISLYKR